MRHICLIAITVLVMTTAGCATAPPATDDTAERDSFDLLQQNQRLQEQVRDLRGQVDTLKYQLDQNEQGQRDLYENLDQRLTALENGGRASSNGGPTGRSAAGGNDYGAPAGGGGGNPQVQAQYQDAFNKLQNGQYNAAISGFKGFLDQNPESDYSDNAWYWLGEANYVQNNSSASLQAFQTVVNRFKASDKVPDSLYKIGVIQSEQGQTDNAMGTLRRVVSEYPDANAAQRAREKLQSLGG